jgi:heavy metal sensor kinase
MLRSFRLKIGLLNLCLSGLLLLGFCVLAVSALNRVGIERVDRELRALADPQVRRIHPPGHWQVFDNSLRAVHGKDAARQFVVHAARTEGDVLYVSADWPEVLPRHAIPLSLASAPGDLQDDPPPRGETRGETDEVDPLRGPPRDTPPRRMPVRGPVYATFGVGADAWRVMTVANAEVTLSLAMNLSGLRVETRRFQRSLLVLVPLGLLLIVAGGWLIGHMALRPVNLIVRTAEAVTAHRLDARIPETDTDAEFGRLISVINGMLERLERSFRQATRFSADAAHELKTPLAILQAQTERCLQRAPDGSAEQREYAEQLDEVQRLRSILRKLLLLSQADAGHLPLSIEIVNLADLIRAAADDLHMLAPGRKVTLKTPSELRVKGDADLLNQAIENLVSNAIKFGDPEGPIGIELVASDGKAVTTVSNTGDPIPEQDRDRIFDRFHRGDKSRSRKIEGSGLGLSLAREIARAHGGDLTLEKSDRQATVFALALPLTSP